VSIYLAQNFPIVGTATLTLAFDAPSKPVWRSSVKRHRGLTFEQVVAAVAISWYDTACKKYVELDKEAAKKIRKMFSRPARKSSLWQEIKVSWAQQKEHMHQRANFWNRGNAFKSDEN
jgi:hypothetical protein